VGTGRLIAAVFGKQRRNKPLVKPDKDYQRKSNYFIEGKFQNNAKIG
jgi:hypothetical protein